MDEDGDRSWVSWLLQQPGYEWLCEVDIAFIEDQFNSYGLRAVIPAFREALETILGPAPRWNDTDAIHAAARSLYGLLHARFIVTSKGLQMMLEKYERKEFGVCPRFLCHGVPTLPLGLSSDLGMHPVKLFCPRCEDVYDPVACSTVAFGYAAQSKDADAHTHTHTHTHAHAHTPGGGRAGEAATRSSSAADPAHASVRLSGRGSPAGLSALPGGAVAGASSVRVTGAEHAGAVDGKGSARGAAAAGTGPLTTRRASAAARASQLASARVALRSVLELDGAFFGPTFAHMLLLAKPQLLLPKTSQTYVPRIYGFRVHNQRGRLPLAAGDSRGVYASAVSCVDVSHAGDKDMFPVVAGVPAVTSFISDSKVNEARLQPPDYGVRMPSLASHVPLSAGHPAHTLSLLPPHVTPAMLHAVEVSRAESAAADPAISNPRYASESACADPSHKQLYASDGVGTHTHTPTHTHTDAPAGTYTRVMPLTTPYLPGRKPIEDDFDDDDDDDAPQAPAVRKRSRRS